MKKINKTCLRLALVSLLCLSLAGCTSKTDSMNNPLLQEFDTPFQTPPFDKIKLEHFKPAMQEAMQMRKQEIEVIIKNPAVPDFDNTIAALDGAGEKLQMIVGIFSNLYSAHTNPQMQELAMELMPELSRHSDEISLNPDLFKRVKEVYERRGELGLNDQQMRTLEKYYKDFVREGANLSEADKAVLMEINQQLSVATLQYGDNVLKETNAFRMVVDNVDDLKGLPAEYVAAAAQTAKAEGMDGKYVFTPNKPSWIPFLQYCENRPLREKLYKGYYMRGDNNNENDNKALVEQLVNLRLRRAKLLGYSDYEAYVLEENMAKNAQNVFDFLGRVWEPALKVAKNDLAAMQAIADKEGADYKLASWDWWYYAEKLRKEKYDLDEQEIKPYLELNHVRDGVFYVANKLYGITFEKRTDIPVYQEDVETVEVKDKDGSHLAIFYMDYYTRESKGAGAWCTGFRGYSKKDGVEKFPLVSVVFNFPNPVDGGPVLLSWDDAETLFHECGHALHSFFSRGDYNRICGNLPNDMVELPSQVNEHWASAPSVLKEYAKHYQTGEPMSDALIQKIVNSSYFNQGFTTVEYVAASLLDMMWYKSDVEKTYDVDQFEKEALDSYGLIPEILPRYRSTYFSHIFDGGYSVGYYVYLWAEVLDADAFDAYEQSGDIFNQDLAAKFRKYVLAEGGWDDPMTQYVRFRGQEPTETPLLRNRGLL